MKLTRFILAVHCHQPVGNFGWVFEEAYQSAYLPFVDLLERHPKVRVVFHYSGSLLDWLSASHPDFLRRLKTLVQRRQIEFLGSGYYEPILVLVPDRDALGQLDLMQRTLGRLGLEGKNGDGKSAQGVWLSERVWEPGLTALLSQAGIQYAIVDDNHLALAGIKEPDRFGYYLTEDQGASVAVFPSSKALRYAVPFHSVEEVIGLLKNFQSDRPQTVVLADDGEKFGFWPGTKKWVYDEGWLEKFFSALEQNADWLEITTFQEALKEMPPLGRVYMPVASYEEMIGWSGGTFRNFFTKYSEADAMHKKMLWISRRLEENLLKKNKRSGNARRLNRARRHLYMAQSNDAYWHGIFGGLYLRHLRRAVYQNLLEAEKLLDDVEHPGAWVRADQTDIDADRQEEVLLRSNAQTLLIDSNQGGQLVEWSDKEQAFNLLDTLTRRQESYHAKLLSKQPAAVAAGEGPASIHERQEIFQPELADLLVYDRHRRASLVDHVFAAGESAQAFARGTYQEHGDFVQGAYRAVVSKKRDSVRAALTRRGNVLLEETPAPLHVTKKLTLSRLKRAVDVSYGVSNPSEKALHFLFGVEWNVGLRDAHVNRIGDAPGVKRFAVSDPAVQKKVFWDFDREARLWYFPVETISDSEKGIERNYQGACLTFVWDLKLPPGGAWEVRCRVNGGSSDEEAEA